MQLSGVMGHSMALVATLDAPRVEDCCWRALLGEAVGSAGRSLLADAIECAENETGGKRVCYPVNLGVTVTAAGASAEARLAKSTWPSPVVRSYPGPAVQHPTA